VKILPNMESKYNVRSPAVKRLMKEAAELRAPSSQFFAAPLEENLFEWHFTVRGPQDTDYQGGVYHGRILIPPEYPMKPPDIIVLTPNGRFEVGKKICLSISGHHPETWQPSWSIRTALLAIIGFMPSPGAGTIGSLDYSPEERQGLARGSVQWACSLCGRASCLLLPEEEETQDSKDELKKVLETVKCGPETKKENTKKETNADQPKTSSAASANESVSSNVSENRAPEVETEEVIEESSSASGWQMYDFLIMLLVAGIGALLYRRINLSNPSGHEAEGE